MISGVLVHVVLVSYRELSIDRFRTPQMFIGVLMHAVLASYRE